MNNQQFSSKDKKNNSERKSDGQDVTQGAIFKKIRQEKGLSLDAVHEATKIPMDALRAVEEGYTVRTLSSFYYKGFLKIYCNYLDLDINEVVSDHKTEELPKYVKKDVEDFDFVNFISKHLTREIKQKIVIVTGILILFWIFFKVVGFFTQDRPPKGTTKVVELKKSSKKAWVKRQTAKVVPKKTERQMTQKNNVKKAQAKVVMQKSNRQTVKPATAGAVSARNESGVILTIRSKKESWLRVETDGVIVFQAKLRVGAVETWIADKKIEIAGRNINALEFELNGKMIGTLGSKNRPIKAVTVTKDGLTVTK